MTDEPVPSPPRHLVAAAAGAVMASASLLASRGFAASLLGYALSTFVALTCVTGFRWLDNRRRQNLSYVSSPRLGRIGTLVATAALLVATAHVWSLATELAS